MDGTGVVAANVTHQEDQTLLVLGNEGMIHIRLAIVRHPPHAHPFPTNQNQESAREKQKKTHSRKTLDQQ